MTQHPVLEALEQRPPDARVCLVIEGGGMRGAVSGGMALALHEAGLANSFDAVYGASAGTLNGMWLVSGRIEEGIPTWTDPRLVRELIRRRRAFSRRPIVDVAGLIEHRYEQLAPGIFRDVLRATTELHPVATDVSTGEPVDLHEHIADETTLRLALRATAGLPLLSGPPVQLGEHRLLDAGLSAAIPFRAALADGATHLLILRSRRVGEVAGPPSARSAWLMGRLLDRIDPAVTHALLTRAAREGEDEAFLARHDRDPQGRPHILSVRPAADSAVPARLERDISLVRRGLESGRRAVHELLQSRVSDSEAPYSP